MTKSITKPSIICFGEILWDNLPSGRTAGGAPMNVAYHLNRVGAESQLISRIGDDQPGADLVNFFGQKGLSTNFLQTDSRYPTGEVIAKVMDNHEVAYEILPDAAWDFIDFDPKLSRMANVADAFVFGSLAARNSISRDTLLQTLDSAKFRVLDINLRAPHYSREVLELLLPKADFLKLNHDELLLLTDWFYKSGAPESDSISFLQQKFDIAEIIVTKGSEGASYYSGDTTFTGKAYSVTVADTVGAGDSFLAAFLYKKLTGTTIPKTLDYALAMGAFIAGQSGACPAYTLSDLDHFIDAHQRPG
jgi:fructokinase